MSRGRGSSDNTSVWSPRDWYNTVTMERQESLETRKEDEFNPVYTETNVLAG